MSADNSIPSEWYFITSPQKVSWTKGSSVREVSTYGSNSPYQNYGSTKLRTLLLDDVLIEGFSDSKAIEDNVVALESCMKMVIDEGSGYAAPYCWHLYAGSKSYGIFLLVDVKIKEQMRDMSGKATRAKATIKLQEVSPSQVSSGTDITTTAATGSLTSEAELGLAYSERNNQASAQDAAVAGSRGRNGGGGANGANGANGQSNANGGGGGRNGTQRSNPGRQPQTEANIDRLRDETRGSALGDALFNPDGSLR